MFIIFQAFLTLSCETIHYIDMCVKYIYAPSTFNRYLYDQQLCIECELGYIVSKDYKSCIEFRFQLSLLQYANCKRFAQDRLCAEALDGIQLLPNNQYTIVKDQKFFERCAIVNESETECLFPRFGFILDIITKSVFKDTLNTFCALFNSMLQLCQKFQQRFASYFYTQQGIYLGEHFVNPDQILGFSNTIQCKDNFQFFQFDQDKLIGCFKQKPIAKVYYPVCQQGYALKDDGSKCQVVIPFCQEYFEIQGKELCSKCIPFYKLHLQSCIKMSGCLFISRNNPNKCLRCDIDSILTNGECILKNQRYLFNQQNLEDKRSRHLKILQNLLNDSTSLFYDPHFFEILNQSQRDKNQQDQFKFKKKYLQNKQILQNNLGKVFSQPPLLKQASEQFDQTEIEDQCVFNQEMKCIYCINSRVYYVDEQKNKCFQRIRSIYCEHQIQNFDACLSLQCQINTAINENLMENVDLKNLNFISYLIYLSEPFLGSDYFMTDSEKDQLKKIYKFYGIEFGKQDQICVKLVDKLQNERKEELIYRFYKQYYFQYEENIINRQEFPHLTLKFNQDFEQEIKDISFEKCIKYNKVHSFCLQCEKGFYFNSKTMRCEQNIQKCIIHTILNTCLLCQSGYNLVQGTHCEAICGISVPGSVDLFHSFYTISNTETNFTICKETQVPCKQFVNDKCIECFEGYYLDISSDNNCVVDSYFPDCKIVDQMKQNNTKIDLINYTYQGKQCIQCQEKYVLFQGLCFCQTQKCMIYIYCDQKKCLNKFRSQFIGQLNLGSNQYLEKNGSYYNVLDCQIDNCFICHEGNICLKCKYGFYQIQNKQACQIGKKETEIAPIENIQNCLILSKDQKSCFQCDSNYFLKKDLKCHKKCDPEEQMVIDSEFGNFCLVCPDGCQKCNLFDNGLNQKELRCVSCFQNYFWYFETLQCRKICVFYQKGRDCVRQCDAQNFLLGNTCVQQCPQFYKIENGKNICRESCEGQYRYDDDPQKCSTQCELNYLIDEQKQLCKKCQIENCQICSKYQLNICIKCSKNYFNFDGQCFFYCFINPQVLGEKICDQSKHIRLCLEQKQGNCVKCQPNSQYFFNLNACQCQSSYEYSLYLNMCIKKCDDDQCQICSYDKQICIRCKPNKYLIDNLIYGNSYCIDECPIGYFPSIKEGNINEKKCLQCPLNCFSCKNQFSCTECNYDYKEYYCNGNLVCICNSLECEIYQQFQIKYLEYQCCQVKNCSKCEQNIIICQKCNKKYPYLYLNTCLENCPEGTYSNENNQCELCHPLCKNCSSKSSKDCLKCMLQSHFVESNNTCRCAYQKVFFQNRCYSDCPRFTKIQENDDRVCQQYCLDSFPVFDENGVFERCENNFNSQDSKYCEQNLLNLEKYVSFHFQSNQSISQTQSIVILITILQTPRECYDFQLRVDPKLQDDLLNLHFKDSKIDKIEAELQIPQIQQKYQGKCQKRICTMYLLIYYNSLLKKTIKFNIDLKSQIIYLQSISQANLKFIQKYEIKLLETGNSFLNSLMSVSCENLIFCSDKSIVLYPSSSLKVKIQILSNDNSKIIKNLYLIPIQVYIIEGNNSLLKMNDFQYNNFYPSKIQIEINFDKELKGNLIIVLRAIYWKNEYFGYEHFVDKNLNQYFIQQSIEISIVKQSNQQQKSHQKKINSNEQILYLFLFISNFIICLIILIVVSFKLIKKCQKNKQIYQQYDKEEQEESNKMEQKSSYFQSQMELQQCQQEQGFFKKS